MLRVLRACNGYGEYSTGPGVKQVRSSPSLLVMMLPFRPFSGRFGHTTAYLRHNLAMLKEGRAIVMLLLFIVAVNVFVDGD